MKPQRAHRVFVVSVIFTLLLLSGHALAQQGSFRMEFITNYVGNRFQQQVILVKKNKEIIPGEVKSLTADAMAEGKTFEERMYLLDVAQAMATMHKYWNKDEGPLLEIETIVRMEIERENKRKAELAKWDKYEKFTGNFVMKEHESQMEAEGLTPVIYPHWTHRVWYECKVCHPSLFRAKRGANDISLRHILEGEQCGACHDGKTAFGAKKKGDCVKCHIAGRPEADRLFDMAGIDHKKLRKVAGRVGAEWKPERLDEGKVPLDRYGNIDWLELKERRVFSPVVSLDEGAKDEIRDNLILFESANSGLKNVLFSHKVHSTWIGCSTCHPAVFKAKLGGNAIKMRAMARGEFCGHCHGKVSFRFADCTRCHNTPKGESVKGALVHKAKP